MAINALAQIGAITSMNLRNMPQRAASSIVALIGIAGVVTVLIGVLSIAEGFRSVLEISGSDQVAIVLRSGATDEMGSGLTQQQTRVIADSKHALRDEAGPVVSPELYVVVNLPLLTTGTEANVPLRGVGQQATKLRGNFRIIEGRNFTPGTFEVVVGKGASMQFAGLKVGDQFRAGTTNWTVTGIFEDRGSVAESEIWTDATVLQGAYNRGTSYQSVRVKLTSPDAMQAFTLFNRSCLSRRRSKGLREILRPSPPSARGLRTSSCRTSTAAPMIRAVQSLPSLTAISTSTGR